LDLCRYVVLNPVRAKIVEEVGQWKWSNYRMTSGKSSAPKWLEVDWRLAAILGMSILLLATAGPASRPLRAQLTSALQGKEALETVRRLANLPASRLRAEGITIENNKGEGEDEVIKVQLSPPLTLYLRAKRRRR
jgi:hypothetical protein